MYVYMYCTYIRVHFASFRSWEARDDVIWGGLWLYRCTNDPQYLTFAEGLQQSMGYSGKTFDYRELGPANQVWQGYCHRNHWILRYEFLL